MINNLIRQDLHHVNVEQYNLGSRISILNSIATMISKEEINMHIASSDNWKTFLGVISLEFKLIDKILINQNKLTESQPSKR